MPQAFVIYADFKAITEKIHTCQPNDKKSFTEAYQKHTDCRYAYKLVGCYDNKYSKPLQLYRGENAVYKFMESMLHEVGWCKETIKKHFNKPLKMTNEDELNLKKSTKCHICGKTYTGEDVKVRDHCHITGLYRGSAHNDCNLKLQIRPEEIKIPVIFHNLKGYDSHFIMQQTGKIARRGQNEMKINVIPNNMGKYMAFMLGRHLTFLDSFQFMRSSLDKLVSNLPDDDEFTPQTFKKENKLKLMKNKGVYPYDYVESCEKFDDKKLPSKNDFYGILNKEHITDEQYQHAQNVWETFKFKSMGDYHDLYLGSDVLLLADVFENFRKTCLQYYKL